MKSSFIRKFITQISFEFGKGKSELVSKMFIHYKCRNNAYPGTDGAIKRFPVPDDKVSWNVTYDEYAPPIYTSPTVGYKPWADPEIGTPGFNPTNEWNNDTGSVDRKCGSHVYEIDNNGYPINPVGRTGLKGRGLLGRWGSNTAGDAVVTRWKRDPNTGEEMMHNETGKKMLEFVAIKRRDCGEWAIPGGFADKKEDFFYTVQREFFEEAMNGGKVVEDYVPAALVPSVQKKLNDIFDNGTVVYTGYVDDIRNTDQAWISTTVVNFHDHQGELFNDFKFQAGDDAADVKWMDVNNDMVLYANHKSFLRLTAEKMDAYF